MEPLDQKPKDNIVKQLYAAMKIIYFLGKGTMLMFVFVTIAFLFNEDLAFILMKIALICLCVLAAIMVTLGLAIYSWAVKTLTEDNDE